MGKQSKLRSARRAAIDPNHGKGLAACLNVDDVANWSECDCVAYLLEQSRKNHDQTCDRAVFLSPAKTELGDYRHPLFVKIGQRLHKLGGKKLMQDVCKKVYDDGRKRHHSCWSDYRELSMCWHGVGDWLD